MRQQILLRLSLRITSCVIQSNMIHISLTFNQQETTAFKLVLTMEELTKTKRSESAVPCLEKALPKLFKMNQEKPEMNHIS